MTRSSKAFSMQGKNERSVSINTARERQAQSRRDKALSANQRLQQPPRGMAAAKARPQSALQIRARGSASSMGPRGPDVRLERYLRSICKGLPAPFPTRVEKLHYLSRFSLDPTVDSHPMILYHCAPAIAQALIVGPVKFKDLTWHWSRSTYKDGTTARHNWINGNIAVDGSNVPLYDTTILPGGLIGESISTPNTLMSTTMRCLGGIVCVKITCGPTARGYMVNRVLSSQEIGVDLSTLLSDDATSPTARRLNFVAGTTVEKYFYAPCQNPDNLETFTEMNPTFSWGVTDSFCGLQFTFHEVKIGKDDIAPTVEFSYVSALQLALSPDNRHLETMHGNETKDAKTSTFGYVAEGGEISAGWALANQASTLFHQTARAAAAAMLEAGPEIARGAMLAAPRALPMLL
jgi:hypothetical protein